RDFHATGVQTCALPIYERVATCAGFLYRAVTWFREQHGVPVLRILSDNAKVYRVGRNWRAVCAGLGIRRRFTKPRCPWTNGKAAIGRAACRERVESPAV